MHYFEVGGITFPVIGQVERRNGDIVPLVEVNMMTDERYKQITEESAVNHFRKWYGREPESLQEAIRRTESIYRKVLA